MAKLKISLDEYHASGKPIIIELGCGPRKKPGRIGIDILDLQEVDIVADLNEGFPFFV
jgi:predicted SAM-dependent methyltransferase